MHKPILLKRFGYIGCFFMSQDFCHLISENKQFLETEVACGPKPQVACIQLFSTHCILID